MNPCNYLFLLTTSLALAVSSCATSRQSGTETRPVVADSHLHALMTGNIDVLFSQIEVLAFEQHRTQTELDLERSQKLTRIADAAAALQQSTAQILALQPTLAISPELAPAFTRLAQQLKTHSGELEQLARSHQIPDVEAAIARTRNTCTACHTLFRDN